MRRNVAAKDNNTCKIGIDTSDTRGIKGAGSFWQANFGMALNEADLLFAVRREPAANRIVFQVAHDVFDNWFRVEEISEKPDASFDREVQKVLSALNAKAVFTQFAVYERLFGWAIIALSYADYSKGPDAPVHSPREIIELLPFSSFQFTVQSSDEDKDPESPRFGLPILYTLRRNNAGQRKLHFSRVIHGATRLLDHPYKGMSALEPVYDDLTVLRNIRWGLGQTIFRYGSGFPDVEVKGAKRKQLDDLENSLRCGEAWMLKWTDFDFENRTVNITPEKGSEPRQLKISPQLISMLNSLPREKEEPFACSSRHFTRYFRSQRANVANKLKNDRIRKITFHTLRHWKATMEYHKTRDILHVMKMLGHRNIQNTLLYTQLISFENDDYHSATAQNVQDAQKLIEAGFEYVCEFSDVKIFRRRK